MEDVDLKAPLDRTKQQEEELEELDRQIMEMEEGEAARERKEESRGGILIRIKTPRRRMMLSIILMNSSG